MTDPFWAAVRACLAAAAQAKTADELIAAVGFGPGQADAGADAFFSGSGGDGQLSEVLDDNGCWDIDWVEGDYWWKATSRVDGSVVEYIEGDLYRRRGPTG